MPTTTYTATPDAGIAPTWGPLVNTVDPDVASCFMYMYGARLDDQVTLHAYKHVATRHYLFLSDDGRCFDWLGRNQYRAVELGWGIRAAFDDWEQLIPQPQKPEAVRALLRRVR